MQLPESVMFDVGSAELKPGARDVLKHIAPILRDYKDKIIIEGHTDNYPVLNPREFRSNWHLSASRAFSVVKYLTGDEKIPPERISAWGYAEYNPIAPFDTISNRSKNRRIEIRMIHEKPLKSAVPGADEPAMETPKEPHHP
jgi:chemotaxis protein MotB